MLLQSFCYQKYFLAYLRIYFKYEEKIELELIYNNDIDLSKVIRVKGISSDTKMTYCLQLLTYGAAIYDFEADKMYHELVQEKTNMKEISNFMNILFHMELKNTFSVSNIYFYFNPFPSFFTFLTEIDLDNSGAIEKSKGLFAFDNNVQLQIKLQSKYRKETINRLMLNSTKFPSLCQLARDALRQGISRKYGIQTSCQLYTVINNLDIGSHIKDLLLYRKNIYVNNDFN